MDHFQRLPEDLVREVVIRVPYIFHNKLRCVSKMLKDIVGYHGELYKERTRLGVYEKLVFFLDQSGECKKITFYDPLYNLVAKSPSMPTEFHFTDYTHCLCVAKNLIVIGLQYENKPTSTIMVFDFMSHTWKKGAVPIHEFGSQIACCASPEGLVYIAGENQEVAVYDLFEDRWEHLPEMQEKIGWVRVYYIDGMFHVASVYAKRFYRTDRFNPVSQQWDVLHGFELLRCYSPLSFIADQSGQYLYSFQRNKVMVFDFSKKEWKEEECHGPPHLECVGSREYDDQIFVTGTREGSLKFELYDDEQDLSVFRWRWVFRERSRITAWSYYNSLVILEI